MDDGPNGYRPDILRCIGPWTINPRPVSPFVAEEDLLHSVVQSAAPAHHSTVHKPVCPRFGIGFIPNVHTGQS